MNQSNISYLDRFVKDHIKTIQDRTGVLYQVHINGVGQYWPTTSKTRAIQQLKTLIKSTPYGDYD